MRDVIKLQRRTESGLEDVLSFGDIVASGSNANGEWVRWSDGTQICRSTIILTGLSIEDRAQVWASYSYTPPAAFVGEYDIYISKALAEDTSKGRQVVLGTTYYSSGTLSLWSTGRSAWNYHPGDCVRGVSTTADKIYTINTATIRVVAIGKWK